MLRRIQLVNFRRHADTTVEFDDEAHLVLVDGPNGAGKSTLMEAVLWAFYGEGREGRANLDALIRRGGEDEGMRVEVDFERGGQTFRVVRSRRQGHSRARLEVGGVELARAPSSVTGEISRLFGMDAAGFRLAVYAQQKELDALASFQPARRSAMLGRLIGIDAVTAARGDAALAARTARAALATLAGDDHAQLQAEHEAAHAAVEAAQQQDAACASDLAQAETDFKQSAATEEEYQAANRRRLAALGASDQLAERITRIAQQLDALPTSELRAHEDVDLLTGRAMEAHRSLQEGRNMLTLWQQRPDVEAERDEVHAQLAETIRRVDTAKQAAGSVATLQQKAGEATAAADAARKTLLAAQQQAARTAQQLQDARDAADDVGQIGELCEVCGQAVSGEHLAQVTRDRQERVERLAAALALAEDDVSAADATLTTCVQAAERADGELARARTLAAQEEELRARETELLRRRQQLDAALQRHPSSAPEVDRLVEVAHAADEALRTARSAQEHNARVRQAQDARARLETELSEAKARLDGLMADASVDERLTTAHEQHLALATRLAEVKARAGEAAVELAVARERATAAAERLASSRARRKQRRELSRKAQAASDAAKILENVADTLATRLRPALEGEVSQLLDRLSEGRYSRVRFDDDFNCEVEDDGGFHPLASFSGGEVDLVALAVRLALGMLVADRSDGVAPEFLILDECFGSQDQARQHAILAALRNLDDVYRQVLIISHVPGVRERVDRVVSVGMHDGSAVVS